MRQWIDGLVKTRYKNAKALALKVGMTESGFSRGAKAGTFEVENCLRLAAEVGVPAADVLAMAGKSDINTLIESLYGTARQPHSNDAMELARAYDALQTPKLKASLKQLSEDYLRLEAMAAGTIPATRRGHSRGSSSE